MKIRQVPMRVAIAIPLTGFEDEPSSPVIRDETTEKKKPKTMIASAERRLTPRPGTALSWGRKVMKRARAIDPPSTIEIGMSRSVRGRASSPAPESRRSRKEARSEEHTSELQSLTNLVCRLLLEKKKHIERQRDSTHGNVREHK